MTAEGLLALALAGALSWCVLTDREGFASVVRLLPGASPLPNTGPSLLPNTGAWPPPESGASPDLALGPTGLDFMPDIRASVLKLRRHAAKTGNDGAVAQTAALCERFCLLAYRRLGRAPQQTSALDAGRAAGDLAALREEIVNAVQAMYLTAHVETARRRLDEVTEDLLRDTARYIAAVRKLLSGGLNRNPYEAGRGFPVAWALGPATEADVHYNLLP
jgi:hypothetical protein